MINLVEIKGLNCENEVADFLFDFFASKNRLGRLEELTIDKINPVIDKLDSWTMLKFAKRCPSMKKLKVKNLFFSSTQARKALSKLVLQVLSLCDLEYLSLSNFSGFKDKELGFQMLSPIL